MITTDRLLIRDLVDEDWPAVHAYCADPVVMRFMLAGEPFTEQRSRAFVAEAVAWAHQTPRWNYGLAIVLRGANQVIGGCRLSVIDGNWQEADIGYALNRQYWQQGYGTEAVHGLVSYGFTTLQLHRISCTIVTANTASRQCVAKVGMQCEGQFREKYWLEDRWWDAAHYAMLASDWTNRYPSMPMHT